MPTHCGSMPPCFARPAGLRKLAPRETTKFKDAAFQQAFKVRLGTLTKFDAKQQSPPTYLADERST